MAVTGAIFARSNGDQCIVTPGLNSATPFHGDLTFHDLMIYIAAGTTIICCICTTSLTAWHLFNYTVPREQKHLVRIILTPAVFALFSLFGTWFYSATNYLTPIAELYECFALVALFMLLLAYIAPSSEPGQRQFFASLRTQENSKTKIQEVGSLRWFYVIWLGVFQILPGRVITVIASEIVQAKLCYDTKKYWRANTAISVVQGILTAICMISIIKFYKRFRRELHTTDRRILFKLITFKLIVFIQLLQRIVLNALSQHHVLKGSGHLSYNDLAIGMNSFLTCIEVCIFSISFIWPYSARPYTAGAKNRGVSVSKVPFGRALLDALNIADVIGAIMKSRDMHRETATNDDLSRRQLDMAAANGRINGGGQGGRQEGKFGNSRGY